MSKKQLLIIWIAAIWAILLLGLKQVSSKLFYGKYDYLYGIYIQGFQIPKVLFDYNYRIAIVIGILVIIFLYTLKNANIKKETVSLIEQELLIIMILANIYFLIFLITNYIGHYVSNEINAVLFLVVYLIRLAVNIYCRIKPKDEPNN